VKDLLFTIESRCSAALSMTTLGPFPVSPASRRGPRRARLWRDGVIRWLP